MSAPEGVTKVFNHIDQNLGEHVEFIRRYMMQPSVSARNEGIEETAQMTCGFVRDLGCEDTRIIRTKGNPVVFGTLTNKRAKKTLILYNMYDVQPPEPLEQWVSPPFKAEMSNGKIIARGAVNTKGPLGSSIKCVESFLKVSGEVPVNLIFLFEGEEELGSPSLPAVLQELAPALKAADAVFFLGPRLNENGTPVLSLGWKGNLYLELEVKARETDLHSMYGSILENPAWRLTWALNSLKDRGDRVLAEGFYDDVCPPSEDDMHLVDDISKRVGEQEIMQATGSKGFRGGLRGVELFREFLFMPTLNIDGLLSGYTGPGTKTIVPSRATAKLDIRFVPDMKHERILELVKRHLERNGFSDVAVRTLLTLDWSKVAFSEGIAQSTLRAMGWIGQKPLVYPISPSSAPFSLFTKSLGLPLISAGFAYTHLAHRPNEYITVEQIRLNEKLLAGLMYDFAA